MREVSRLEEVFLLAIIKLQNNAYGVTIRNMILELIGKKYHTVHCILL